MATLERIALRRRSGTSVPSLRVWHAYGSSFIAPMVLFFSLSGALQIFDLHEAHGSYVPPPFVTALGQLHKKQTLEAPHRPRSAAPGGARTDAPGARASAPRATPLGTRLLQWLFFAEALCLASTTVLGLWIGVTHPKHAAACRILAVAGIAVPGVLLLL